MPNKKIQKEFISYIFKSIKSDIALEGGAALYYVYNIDRLMSPDIDLTTCDIRVFNDFYFLCKNFAIARGFKIKQIKSPDFKRLTFFHKDQILSVDLYFLNSRKFTEISKKRFNISKTKCKIVYTHSLEDIGAEKICCILDANRFKSNDVLDLAKILDKDIDQKKIKKLLRLKLISKNMDFSCELFKISLFRFKNINSKTRIIIKKIEKMFKLTN